MVHECQPLCRLPLVSCGSHERHAKNQEEICSGGLSLDMHLVSMLPIVSDSGVPMFLYLDQSIVTSSLLAAMYTNSWLVHIMDAVYRAIPVKLAV